MRRLLVALALICVVPAQAQQRAPDDLEARAIHRRAVEAVIWGMPAKKGEGGAVAIQFGGCDGKVPNCLPIMPGRNRTVRLYRPRPETLNGSWKFPEPQAVE